jgi:hypothetical protein
MVAQEVPPDLVISGGRAQMKLHWADGTRERAECQLLIPKLGGPPAAVRWAMGMPAARLDPETQAHLLQRLPSLGTGTKDESSEDDGRVRSELAAELRRGVVIFGNVSLSAGIAKRILADAPTCVLEVSLALTRPTRLFELPLREGASASAQGVHLDILAIEERTISGTKANRHEKQLIFASSQVDATEQIAFHLVDRPRGILWRKAKTTPDTSLNVFNAIRFERGEIVYAMPQAWRGDNWVPMPEWGDAYRVAAVRYQRAGVLRRELAIDQWVLMRDKEKATPPGEEGS